MNKLIMRADYIEGLPEELKGKFLMIIYQYAIKGIKPKLSGMEKAFFKLIKNQIDFEGTLSDYGEDKQE